MTVRRPLAYTQPPRNFWECVEWLKEAPPSREVPTNEETLLPII